MRPVRPAPSLNLPPPHVFDQGNPAAERNTRWAVLLTVVVMVAEIIGGVLFNSMALLADGWHEITAYRLSRTPEEERSAQRLALDNLGRKIVLEWVRPNDVRKVDTDMLRTWGSELKKTAKQDPQQLARTIAAIDQEVEAVLD